MNKKRIGIIFRISALLCFLFAHAPRFLSVWYVAAWEENSFSLYSLYKQGFSYEFGDMGPQFFREVSVTAILMTVLGVLSGILGLFARIRPRMRQVSGYLAIGASVALVSVYVQMMALYGMVGEPRARPEAGTWWFAAAICAICFANMLARTGRENAVPIANA